MATAGAAAPALVAVGVGVASSTAVTAGSAAIGVAAGALVATTVGAAAIKAGVVLAEAAEEAVENLTNKNNNQTNNNQSGKDVSDYPGNDQTKSPGDGWEWRGNGDSSSRQGSWYNPETGESLHPDLNHPEPVGPHWDYIDPDGFEYRLFPDGSWTLK